MHKLSTSIADRRVLLPNEARLVDQSRQAVLTERHLLPVLTELEAFFLAVRSQVDAQLEFSLPIKKGRPYPYGQCLEISQAAQRQLQRQDLHTLALSPSAQSGRTAFLAFRRAGGELRQVWGDLRGEFFQNAFQLGTLYLDVSNDTVTPTKPKVEILPFTEARFVPIADYRHFARVAERYWQVQVYPNHLLPEWAPYCPLLYVAVDGRVMLGEATLYMVSLTQTGRFEPSEAVLCDAAMPSDLFKRARAGLADIAGTLPDNPEHGRDLALRACRDYRRKRWHVSGRSIADVIRSVAAINDTLLPETALRPITVHSTHISFATKVQNMSTSEFIKIDGVEYSLSSLSEAARRELAMLQATDAKLAELQRDVAINQTARNAYANALAALLPPA
ncbi:hypothetical protein ACHMW6_23815 [Pseudoduganella sp. UC29_106]|uniref:hypothetical protein n=1 Tax=Pseudoduganella sp. UC29_106 TaxID=3374553 RepID=UPI0037580AF2